MKESFLSKVKSFHDDERGDDVLKNIMMLAVAALIVVALIAFGNRLIKFLFTKEKEIYKEDAIPTTVP